MTKIIANTFIITIQAYRRWVSPLLAPRCRFYPSCSEYALVCLQQEHVALALFKIAKRLLRCNPLHPGGVDIP